MNFKSVVSQKPLLEGKRTHILFKFNKVSSTFVQIFEGDATTQ